MAVTRYTCIVKEPQFFLLLLLDERFQISSLLLTICFKNAPASATDFFLFFLSIKLMLAVSLLNGVTSNIRVTE